MNEQWVFSFYMYLYTYVRKAKNWVLQNWCFRTVVLGKTLESPLDCGGQSILKEISPEYSLEALMLKLKLQYFGHLMRSTDSLEKTLMLGKAEGEEDDRGSSCAHLRGWWLHLIKCTRDLRSSRLIHMPGAHLFAMGNSSLFHIWIWQLHPIIGRRD